MNINKYEKILIILLLTMSYNDIITIKTFNLNF